MFGNDSEGFLQKNTTGVMAKYCQRCNQHIDLHGTRRAQSGRGTIRGCPEEALAQAQQQRQTPSVYQHQSSIPATPDSSIQRVHSSLHFASPSASAPFGTDATPQTPDASYVRVRKLGEMTPSDHLGGSSCNVVNDPKANDFIPVHIAGKSNSFRPQGHLSGAAAQSHFDELQEWTQPGSRPLQHQSSMRGGGLIPK